MKAIRFIVAIFCTALIAACGGGDSSVSTPANFAGQWGANIGGTAYVYSITQSGSNLNMTRITPPLAGLIYIGQVSGNTAAITAYVNNALLGTSTITLTNPTTASWTVNTCTPPAGYSCAAPGTTIIINR